MIRRRPRRAWQNRHHGRIASIIRVLPDGRVRYRYKTPLRRKPTMYTRPFVSTRTETAERFAARFREVRR